MSYRQYCGFELRGRPGEAQVAHFHGPLAMGPLTINWKVPAELALVTGDKPTDLRGYAGTMNAEHGGWVVVRNHNGDVPAFSQGRLPRRGRGVPPRKRPVKRGVNREINRADQAGDVARGRQLASLVGQRQARIAVEIDDEDVVLHDQSLPEAEVAMMTDVQPADPGWQERMQPAG